MPEHGVLVHLLALTFKHAVEFSSFGCTPRVRLVDSRLGQLDLLYSGSSSESNPIRSPFELLFQKTICVATGFRTTSLTLFSPSVRVKSDFAVLSRLSGRYRSRDSGHSRQPA